MRPEWREHLDELMEQFQARRHDLNGLQERLAALESTVTTDDEMITVRVGAQGRLTGLEFHPRVYRTLAPHELAEAVVATVQRATDEVTEKIRAEMGSLAPEGGDFDVSKLMPDRPDDFDSVKEHYGFRDR